MPIASFTRCWCKSEYHFGNCYIPAYCWIKDIKSVTNQPDIDVFLHFFASLRSFCPTK